MVNGHALLSFADHTCFKNQQGLVPAHVGFRASGFHARVQVVFKKEHKHRSDLCVAGGFGVPGSRRYRRDRNYKLQSILRTIRSHTAVCLIFEMTVQNITDNLIPSAT